MLCSDCSYFHKLTSASKRKLGSTLGAKKDADEDSDVEDDDFDGYLAKYEGSLYSEMATDAFGKDFARQASPMSRINHLICHVASVLSVTLQASR